MKLAHAAPGKPGVTRKALASLISTALVAAMLVGVQLTAATPAQAAPGDPFNPAAPVVFIGQGSASQLQRAETTGDGSFVFSNEGAVAQVGYNAIGFNPADNYLYGMVTNDFTAAIPRGSLVRIGEGGVVNRVGTTVYTHPATGATRWFAGAFNPADGYYYISDSGPNVTMRVINVSTGAIVRTITYPAQPGVQDFVFKDGYAWGVTPDGTVRRFNVSTNTGSFTDFPGAMPEGPGGYGAAWAFGNGNLGFSANTTGDVTQLQITNGNTATPTFTVISTVAGPSSSLNDGTSIPGLPADLEIEKSGPANFVSGDRITYDITVTNNGAGVSSGWLVTDTLPTGLSNPTVTTTASHAIAGSTITVSGGRLDPGQAVTISVEADTDVSPPACIVNTASVFGNEEDSDTSNNEASAESCALALEIEKTSTATVDTRVGDTVTYTVTATNTGAGDFTAANPAVVFDDLSGVLDDADYNNDAAASIAGDLDYTAPLLSWSGPLEVDESVEITYTATLKSGGNGIVRNVSWIPDDPGVTTRPTCDPATDGIDDATGQACALEEFDLPRLTISKTADRTALPAIGGDVTFTIVIRNPGPGDYTAAEPATFTDDLSNVLDDADFDDASLTADVGTASRAGDTLTWTGPLGAGDEATITYTVTYTGAGDQILRNQACVPADQIVPGGRACDYAQVPGALLTQWKSVTASSDPVVAGSTLTYTLFFRNEGEAAAEIDAVDDLRYVLDDAEVTAEPTSPDGLSTVRTGTTISISGTVPVGETYTVEYTVTVLPDDERDDSVAANFLLQPGEAPPSGGVCTPVDPAAPNCTTTPITGVAYEKSVAASETPVRTGTELTYTITVRNTGATVVDVLRDDDLSGVLDDATLLGAAESDAATVTATGPAGGVIELRGTLPAGAAAEVTYTVRVNAAADRGDSVAANFLVPPGTTTPPPDDCDPATAQCTLTPIEGFTFAKEVDAQTALPGEIVTYTVTVTNTGGVAYTAAYPASFDDDLSEVLDDAVYNGDATGGATVTGDTLSWSGALAVGASTAITYSVTVDDPSTGDSVLRNTVTTTIPAGECDPDGECATETPISSYTVAKSADATTAMAGDVVTYVVTVTNTGQVAYTAADPATFEDDLSAVLDDATYNGDVSDGGSVVANTLTWSGPLAIGQTVTVSYSVTVNDPLTGDQELTNTVVPTAPGGDCDPDGVCTTATLVASYTVAKSVDVASALPGDVVTYTLTVVNTGDVEYTAAAPASIEDDLSGVLDDAAYNDDATSGAAVTGDSLTWSGPLAVGETVTITYSVTVDDPVTGDYVLRNAVAPTAPGGDCAAVCTTETPVASYRVEKSTTATDVVPGDVVEYTITVTNTGQVDYTAADPASFTDDLSEVLDAATYNGDAASSDASAVDYAAPVLSWEGALDVGETVTITYSVTVNDPATGDDQLHNVVITPPGSGANCAPGSTDPACVADVPAASYTVEKSVSQTSAFPGDVVTYTVTVRNTGGVAYTASNPASFADDLARVLDDATYNGDITAGGSITGDTLTWSGPLARGASVQVTYSVTVNDPASGDGKLRNVVAPTAPGGECVVGECTTDTPIAAYTVTKTADGADVVLGGVIEYTVTVTNVSDVAYTAATPASFTDDMSGVLDDAVYNGDASNGATVSGEELSWSGALAAGQSVTITYSVTVNSPATGDGILRNAVTPDGPGGTCTLGGCVVETPIASYTVTKHASTRIAVVGDRVTFTITVTNTGQVDYTAADPASFTDDLSPALEVATYNHDATGGAFYEEPVLSWSAPLTVGESVEVAYSVTTTATGQLRNVVVSPADAGANCAAGSTDDDCSTTTVVVPPELAATGGAALTLVGILAAGGVMVGVWLMVRRRRDVLAAV